jgi:hypothetical protein
MVRVLRVEGTSWSITASVHVIPVHGRTGLRYEFKSSLAMWPRKVSGEAENLLAQVGWYDGSRRLLFRQGYRGKWEPSPSGTFAHFYKNLATVGAIRDEAGRLEALQQGLANLSLELSSKRR